ncbi:hypothetical protein [Corallococcus macrosporus]|uniref:hypothetical protein n=1 Tax=Corallococcus macrosporus TaxID=35 RepID=UPI000F4F9EAE
MPKSITHAEVHRFIEEAIGTDTHAKRVLSLSNATRGTLHAVSLSVRAMGLALSQARGLEGKHAVKQVDRLLADTGNERGRVSGGQSPGSHGHRVGEVLRPSRHLRGDSRGDDSGVAPD